MKVKVWASAILFMMLTGCFKPAHIASWENARSAAHYSNLGMREINKGKYARAIAYFREALEIDPHLIVAREQAAIAHFCLGNEFLTWRQFEFASVQFKTALALNPNLAEARLGLAAANRQRQLSSLGRE